MWQLRGGMFNFPVSNLEVTAIEADCAQCDAGLPSVGDQTWSANTGRGVEVGFDGI